MRRPLLTLFAVLLLLGSIAPRRASAEEGRADLLPAAPAPAPPDDSGRRWYGWQILGFDLAAGAVVGAGIALENTPANDSMEKTLIGAGAALYLLGGPLVHRLHGNSRHETRSLGLRLGLPLVGGLSGYLYGSASPDPGVGIFLGVVGAGAGALTAIVVDDLVFGWQPRAERRPTWSPTLAPGASGGLTLGVAGAW